MSIPIPWQRIASFNGEEKKYRKLVKWNLRPKYCFVVKMICMEASRTLVTTSKVIEAQYQSLHFLLQILLDINESDCEKDFDLCRNFMPWFACFVATLTFPCESQGSRKVAIG